MARQHPLPRTGPNDETVFDYRVFGQVKKIALAGIGEIAVQQHVPAIAASADWELAATCSRSGSVPGIESFSNLESLLEAHTDIQVVSLCQPPQARLPYALAALKFNCHVMLEKPPAATISECRMLEGLARQRNLSLFATWHSREAEMVESAQRWLSDKTLKRLEIKWREDVHRWHAGQEWIWQAGGFGVFDPGINALSIVTRILPESVHLVSARLEFPANKHSPIAAQLDLCTARGAKIIADFDWREVGEQSWSIEAETDQGELQLLKGGSQLIINGLEISRSADYQSVFEDELTNTLGNEYPRLYTRMARLVEQNGIDMDLAPLELVADAFLLGQRVIVDPYFE